MYCENCGRAINQKANFCRHCGAPLGEGSQAVASAATVTVGQTSTESDGARADPAIGTQQSDQPATERTKVPSLNWLFLLILFFASLPLIKAFAVLPAIAAAIPLRAIHNRVAAYITSVACYLVIHLVCVAIVQTIGFGVPLASSSIGNPQPHIRDFPATPIPTMIPAPSTREFTPSLPLSDARQLEEQVSASRSEVGPNAGGTTATTTTNAIPEPRIKAEQDEPSAGTNESRTDKPYAVVGLCGTMGIQSLRYASESARGKARELAAAGDAGWVNADAEAAAKEAELERVQTECRDFFNP